MIDNKKHTFVIHARPAGVPLELQNLPGDTAVRVTSHICGLQYEGTTTAEKMLRELKSIINRQSEGFYTINEAAQIWADATGTAPKRQREKLWKEIEQGRLRAFDEADKFETLEFSKVKYSCLVREADLIEIGVFPKVPAKSPAQTTTPPESVVTGGATHGTRWKEKARTRAREIIKRQLARDLYPDQAAIADEIAKEFRADGIFGGDGKPLSGATIKRHALKGISSAQGKQLSTTIRRGK